MEPDDELRLAISRNTLAASLGEDVRFDEAQVELARLAERAEHVEVLHAYLPASHQSLGIIAFELGHHADAIRMLERALDERIAQDGRDHPFTIQDRGGLARMYIEVGRLDDAGSQLAEVERSFA